MLEIDGKHLEGGGQLLRTAVCVSALTRQPIRIQDIRALRPGKTGLKAQHLACVNFLGDVVRARIHGNELQSTSLTFRPFRGPEGVYIPPQYSVPADKAGNPSREAEMAIDVGSSGSICLVLQAVLPFILFSPTHDISGNASGTQTVALTITGGTNVPLSPSIDYVRLVLAPMLELIGLPPLNIDLHSRGWSTNSSSPGRATFHITPLPHGSSLPAFCLLSQEHEDVSSRPKLDTLHAHIIAPDAALPIFQRALQSALAQRTSPASTRPLVDLLTVEHEPNTSGREASILLIATVSSGTRTSPERKAFPLGVDALLALPAIRSGQTARQEAVVQGAVDGVVRDLMRRVDAGDLVDERMKDQLVVFAALARGTSWIPRVRGLDARGEREGSLEDRVGELDLGVVEERGGPGLGRRRGGKVAARGGGGRRAAGKRVGDGTDLHQQTVGWVAEQVLHGFGDGIEVRDDGSYHGCGYVCGFGLRT